MENNKIDKNNSDLAESETSGSEVDAGESGYDLEELLLESVSETAFFSGDQEEPTPTDQIQVYQIEEDPIDITGQKKRTLASSGSESGSVVLSRQANIKKKKSDSRDLILAKNRNIPIDELVPSKTAEKKPEKQPRSSVPRTPVQKTPNPAAKSYADRVKNTSKETTKSTSGTSKMDQIGVRADGETPQAADVFVHDVPEQNTEKVSIETILAKPTISKIFIELTRKENIHKIKNFLMSGKDFSNNIKLARQNNKKFISFAGILINIQLEQKNVTTGDFTKQRFLAACHLELYRSGNGMDFCSPLVGRISFDERNPLTKIKCLMGAGFQFLGSYVKGILGGGKNATLIFHLGCFALDYIRKTTPYVDPSTKSRTEAELDPELVSFTDYLTYPESRDGDTFIAGCRNLDQANLETLNNNQDDFCVLAMDVTIGKYGGSIKDRVANNFASMQSSLREKLRRLKASSAMDS